MENLNIAIVLVPSTEIQIFTEMQMRMWLRKWICFQINEAPFIRLQLSVLNGCETVFGL